MPSQETFGESSPVIPSVLQLPNERESLFDRFGWLYALLRGFVFRDDTDGIEVALWPLGGPAQGERLLEVGCGPGFYSCRFAKRFSHLQVLGMDCSEVQLRHAEKAATGLENCTFLRANLLNMEIEPVDCILAARLFTVLEHRRDGMAAIHRLLKPGGRCVIAEPRAGAVTHLPLQALWGLARLESLLLRRGEYREPGHVKTFSPKGFTQLVADQPWARLTRWQDKHYQYAICEKAGADVVSSTEPASVSELAAF